MIRSSTVVCALVSSVLVLTAAAPQGAPSAPPASQAPRPSVMIDPPLVDFGVVAPGSKHPASFVIRNVGSTVLTVERALPSCKCTDISPIDGKSIAPGETLPLSAALSVPRTPGVKEAKVMISFVGCQGMVAANMKGDVTLPIRAEPPFVDSLKGVKSGTVKLTAVDGKPFRVLSVGGRAPILVPAADPTAAPGATQTIMWSLEGLSADKLPQWWVVETDRPDCPLIPLRLRNEVTGVLFDREPMLARFWFPPESVVVAGRVKGGQPVELTTTIEHLNPAEQGRVTAPTWGDVKGVRVPGGEGTAELVSATKRGTDFVDLVVKFTPRVELRGAQYIPLEIETGTGRGLIYVSIAVAP